MFLTLSDGTNLLLSDSTFMELYAFAPPDERVFVVNVENRVYIASAEPRIYSVSAENRAYIVPAESRVYSVDNENRIYIVPA
jgi:hypothetical protein